MGAISSWLLSIAGVVVLSVLAEFVLPEGQINKYTKIIFSFIILLVIIMPLPKLFGKNFDLSNYFSTEQVLQEDYLYQINIDKLATLNEEIAQKVKQSGLKNVEIAINANVLTDNLEIFGVFIDLSEIEFENNFGSTDVVEAKMAIRDILNEYSLLKDVEVKFNE